MFVSTDIKIKQGAKVELLKEKVDQEEKETERGRGEREMRDEESNKWQTNKQMG